MKLWYEQPAESWLEALPIGNGRLGAMVFGRTDREILSLNEDTLWSGFPKDMNPPEGAESFRKAADLARQEKYLEAQKIIEKELTSQWGQSYLPAGDLILNLHHGAAVENYTRDLDLTTAIASVDYTSGGVRFRREYLASAPTDVIAVRISADRSGCISFSAGFECPIRSSLFVNGSLMILKGEAPSHVEPSYSNDLAEPVLYSDKDEERGMGFTLMARFLITGGRTSSDSSGIRVEGADEAIILINSRTSFAGFDVHPFLHGIEYENRCIRDLEKAESEGFTVLRKNHIRDYEAFYHRVELELDEEKADDLPTDKRLFRFQDNQDDSHLYALLFQYGRYLLISSSRPGTQPANLQGIWNRELRPPWSSNYTININTQMNYWPVFTCGLTEFHEPLVGLIQDLSITGEETARTVYGARGFTAHHNTDIWRFSSPAGNHWSGSAGFAFWNVSAGWLCRHIYDQYEYTLDKAFLRDTAYPIMKKAAEFLLDILIEDKNGILIVCPSTSPENTFLLNGQKCNVSATTTMTMTITSELFKNCINACRILGCDEKFAEELEEKLSRLSPLKVGSCGQLLEWYEEQEEFEPFHRHISHLYGLYPANEITIEETPELTEACRKSLELRGDDGTGWSLGWKINQWARLCDGDRALKLLKKQLRVIRDTKIAYNTRGGTYINLFDAHPPFQIDGNFGATSGIAEMLLQSRNKKIFILPALPSSWRKGSVKGLRAKSGISVNIYWDGNIVKSELISSIDQKVQVSVRGEGIREIELKAGQPKRI